MQWFYVLYSVTVWGRMWRCGDKVVAEAREGSRSHARTDHGDSLTTVYYLTIVLGMPSMNQTLLRSL